MSHEKIEILPTSLTGIARIVFESLSEEEKSFFLEAMKIQIDPNAEIRDWNMYIVSQRDDYGIRESS